MSSGKGAAPFATVADYDNALKRHDGYADYLDAVVARFRQGQAAGVVDTKLTIRNVIDQLDTQLAQPLEQSAFYGPVRSFPAAVPGADRIRLEAAYRAMIANRLYPAYRRLRDYLRAEYLPTARETVGLSAMKGGDAVYRSLIRSSTTLPLGAEEVHQLGLSEVARITAAMEKVRVEVGYTGDLAAFLRLSAHRPDIPAQEPRRADAGLLCDRQDRRDQAAGLFLDRAQDRARDPPL